MARFKPGQSGNPNGRPPKNRALTSILEKAGAKTIERDGQKVTRKRIMAELLWDAIATGQMKFGESDTVALKPDEWIGLVQFLYKHIDGPPPSRVDVEHGGAIAVKGYVKFSPDDWDED